MTQRRLFALFAAMNFLLLGARSSLGDKPNVLFILADDLGYNDIGAFNPDTFYETPNIDGLAKRGMKFTSGYSACSVCSPTRASIMTGKYPPRVHITNFIGGTKTGKMLPAPYADHLALQEVTIAERMRDAGYQTFFAGKWHLGDGEYSPNAQGFMVKLDGKKQFYYPAGDAVPDRKDDPKTTDRIANDFIRFLHQNKEKPFYAYLPFLAVHIPVGAAPDLVAKYEAKRKSAPADAWGVEGDNKVRLVQNRADYAAMLEQLDRAIGRILAAVEEEKLSERTIVVFASDNGGLSTAEGHPTSNLPLRGGKGWPYEGGVRVPWIVCAPGLTKAGTVCTTSVVSTDFYPTLLELAGLPLAPQQHLDGVSLVPLLRGGDLKRPPIFWHYPHYANQGGGPCGCVRDGDWKLIEWYEDGRHELYNIAADLSEKKNVAAEHPDKVAELSTKLDTWRKEVGAVMPTPNPNPPKKSAKPAAE